MSDFIGEDILKIWESHHGQLDGKNREEFLRDPAIDVLVTFKWLELDVCISKEPILSNALNLLSKGAGYDEEEY